jgi:hypothetical protein
VASGGGNCPLASALNGTACVPSGATTLSAPAAQSCDGRGLLSQACSAIASSLQNNVVAGVTTTATATRAAGATAAVTAGWNLIGSPPGSVLTGTSGSLFTYQAGDTNYETVAAGSPLKGGEGYWAYFGSGATEALPAAGSIGSLSIQLPAGQWIMVGNPGNSTATVSGVDALFVWDPVAGAYSATKSLAPGQGAWAWSANGAQALITNQQS